MEGGKRMLEIKVEENEWYDNNKNEFIESPETILFLEHSLISLTKWESKHEKPFLNDKDKTDEEIIDYIRCMTINKNVNPLVYYSLSDENIDTIQKYLDRKMTATTINERKHYGPNKNVLTSEVIYAMMIECGIPFECEKWHLNRLIMLIRVCTIRARGPEKMNKKDMLEERRRLNKQRMRGM